MPAKLVMLQLSFCILLKTYCASITLFTKDATVWLPQQTISGKVSGFNSKKIKWHLNNTSGFTSVQTNGTFNFSFILQNTTNLIWVEDASASNITSDTIHYTLGYKPLPEILPFATIQNNTATLNAKIINNPYHLTLKFKWENFSGPQQAIIHNANKQKATAIIPETNGNYYFSVMVIAGEDSVVYNTYITRNKAQLHAFDIEKDHASWIDSAIIYEITPYVFVHDGKYDDITAKLPELKQLGVNTIWLQPVYETHSGEQGYDITDYFSLRDDCGREKQLHRLITTAKNLSFHVLFDFVPNHTSIYHPYAKEAEQYGNQSHYYNFYQHIDDGAEYSSLYKFDSLGFVHYFWHDLVNLDYNNEEVQRWMIEAFKYWLKQFDIDGYRIDAAWAMNARNPVFSKQLQTILKSIKPDILLLAEDKGALKKVYNEGYDAAYDWARDTGWISSWSWATDYDPHNNPTIFNYFNAGKRSALLNKSLFNNGDTTHLRLRFLENNDQPRFITAHGKARTKMASVLLMSLPGLPMIYNGQEIGFERKLNSNKAIFKANETIQSLDTNNLFNWYKQLNGLRIKYDALRSNNMQALAASPNVIYALHRWENNQHIIVVFNLDDKDTAAVIQTQLLKKDANFTNHYVDLLTNEIFYASKDKLNISMKRFSARILLAQQKDAALIAVDK